MLNFRHFLVLSLFILLLIACKNDLETTQKEKDNLSARTDVGKQIEVRYTEKGILTALLHAPKMMNQEDSQHKTSFPEGIHLQLFDSFGRISSTLTSKYGEQDHTTNQMKARDSVKVVSADGRILKTNELIWMENERRMISYGQVEIRNKSEVIFGDTLFADENLKRYIVKKIRGIVNVSK